MEAGTVFHLSVGVALCLAVGAALIFTTVPTIFVALLFTGAHVMVACLFQWDLTGVDVQVYLGIAFLISLYAVAAARLMHAEAGIPPQSRSK